MRDYKNYIVKNKIELYELIYEDLYEGTKEKKKKIIKEIIKFLGYSNPDDNTLKEMLEVVSPKRKISSKEKYLKIPNIKEVEEKLGNDKTGYLFK